MTRRFAAMIAALVAASIAGCSTGGGSAGEAQAPQPGAAPSARSMPACPMDVPGTTVTSTDTPSGVDVTFTTSMPERVPELRNRVLALADLRNDRLGGRAPGSLERGGFMGTTGVRPAPRTGASWAVVEVVDGGARMIVTPDDTLDVDRFRDMVRARVKRLAQGGGCGGDWIP